MKYIVQLSHESLHGKWVMWRSTVYSSAEGALQELRRCREFFPDSKFRAIGFWDLEE